MVRAANLRQELMHGELTPGVERAIAAAQEWARRLHRPTTGPVTLLLGLLDEDEDYVAEQFKRRGLTREALRVIEDYCRFALNDEFLSRECKILRHELTEALLSAGRLQLLAARDTEGDVGTMIATASEGQRESLLDVVRTNLKRLQEAL